MPTLTSLLPITAFIAICLFICKEVLEFFRRRSGDRRKLRAIAVLLAHECELNFWTIKIIRNVFSMVAMPVGVDGTLPYQQSNVNIKKNASGKEVAVIENEGMKASIPISNVHREQISKALLEVAMLDRNLYEVMERAYDALSQVEHVRAIVIDNQCAELDDMCEDLASHAQYAEEELQKGQVALDALYFQCTGKPLTSHRVR